MRPSPEPSPAPWAERFLDSPRGRLVSQLRRGPATVVELAAATGLTRNGVRVHLATLERDGWIGSVGVRKLDGPGKPATLYALTRKAGPLLSSAHQPLLLALLEVLQHEGPPAARKRRLRAAGRALGKSLPGSAGSAGARAVQALEALGSAVELETNTRTKVTVRGLGCPLADAVRMEPLVCGAVVGLLETALDATVTECCERAAPGGPRCRFEIVPR